jgi:transcriptional regulator with XRE-family HTH domain
MDFKNQNPSRKNFKLISAIETEFQLRAKRNPSYSLRSFARDLEVSPSYLSRLFRGKHEISREMAQRILENLKVAAEDVNTALAMFEGPTRRRAENTAFYLADPIFRNPNRLAVHEYLRLNSDAKSLNDISDHFKLSSDLLFEILEELSRAGYVAYSEQLEAWTTVSAQARVPDVKSQQAG